MREMCKERFRPIVEEIEKLLGTKEQTILIAIDGMSASGKTTLGYYLQELFSGNLFHMDDFFLRENQRTPERLAEVGGNVDYERFKREVIIPVLEKKSVLYRPYRCDSGKIQQGKEIAVQRLNIMEGSYSQHPYFGDIYSLRVYMQISGEMQIERIKQRNGEVMLKRFVSEWIPKETEYFNFFQIPEKSLIIQIKDEKIKKS